MPLYEDDKDKIKSSDKTKENNWKINGEQFVSCLLLEIPLQEIRNLKKWGALSKIRSYCMLNLMQAFYAFFWCWIEWCGSIAICINFLVQRYPKVLCKKLITQCWLYTANSRQEPQRIILNAHHSNRLFCPTGLCWCYAPVKSSLLFNVYP